jgi:beta-glucosidase/6-phospho-beta-glucosidase/beta-galactosidase
MKERVGDRLPVFTEAEKKDLKGSVDFLGINTYSSSLVEGRDGGGGGGYFDDLATKNSADPTWTKGASSWLWIAPAGMRKLLRWIKNEYGSPVVYVTENGVDVAGEGEEQDLEKALNDEVRVQYLQNYLAEVGKAIKYDGVDVRGYFLWSVLDNFEWSEGYGSRFGLVHVDFANDQKRTPKKSFQAYADLIQAFRSPGTGNGDTKTKTKKPKVVAVEGDGRVAPPK